ncbi:MAG: T9SS type A sorting domain-containing protein [candidate division Zixibacteria bacterium]|nr:T9SS type A sorting domain-containing protein [candidate division Zixibacteria bacterium]
MKKFSVFAFLILLFTTNANSRIIDVPDEYPTIQEGIDASSDGDTVLVQPGTYCENISIDVDNLVLGSLYLLTSDTSFISTTIIDGNRSGRVIISHVVRTPLITGFSIKNGISDGYGGGIYANTSDIQIIGNKIYDNEAYYGGGGISVASCDPLIKENAIYNNSARFGAGISSSGCTSSIIQNKIFNNTSERSGGGIGCSSTSGIIEENEIFGNFAKKGGGISSSNTDSLELTISQNIIYENSASSIAGGLFCLTSKVLNNFINNNTSPMGGGIYCDTPGPMISNNIIQYNSAYVEDGGGIYCKSPLTNLLDNVISQNSANINGGGIFISNDSNPILRGNQIIENNSLFGGGVYCSSSNSLIDSNLINSNQSPFGGGIYCSSANPSIKRNIIYNNTSVMRGAGIYCYENANPSITHNVIYNNNGNGICCYISDPKIFNNVIASNYSTVSGGIYCISSFPTVMNSIIWGNTEVGGVEILLENESDPYITFCDIQGGWEGEGNIDVDPLFRDPDNNDFHLMATYCDDPYDSPCIDAGNPDYGDTLLDCDWGLGTEICDMGAYSGEGIPTDVPEIDTPSLPNQTSLSQNYPNPFNSTTTISYSLIQDSQVRLDIFNLVGQRIETLLDTKHQSGDYTVKWDASSFPSGIYFYKLTTGKKSFTNKMILLK